MTNFKPQQCLPIYVTIMTVTLIAIIFILDKETPKTVFFILLAMYIGLLIFFWRQHKKPAPTIKIPSLSDYKSSTNKPTALSNFEAEAQLILKQINREKNPYMNEISYYSPYSRSIQHPVSLNELPTPSNEFTEESTIFGTYNTQIWREQFRLAYDQFKQNIDSEIANGEAYSNAFSKLNLKRESINEAEDMVKAFLLDRATQYCNQSLKAVNEINRILVRNFRLSLTKVQSTNPTEIAMDELGRLLDYYSFNRTLPSNYKKISISSSEIETQSAFNMQKVMSNRLDSDMAQLRRYEEILKPMAYFPLERFIPCLLVYILRLEFPGETFKINSENTQNLVYQNKNPLRDIMTSTRTQVVHCLLVQIDNWMSLASMPDFRTKNCLKICLLLALTLIKKQSSINHPILRSLRRLLR